MIAELLHSLQIRSREKLFDLVIFQINELGGNDSTHSELPGILWKNFCYSIVRQNALRKLFNHFLETEYVFGLYEVGFELYLTFGCIEFPLIITNRVLVYFFNFHNRFNL